MNESASSEMKRVGLPLTEAEVAEIDTWGFANRIRNRSDAIRALIRRALQAEHSETP